MSTSNGFSKTLMFGALALACGTLYSAPASAANHSFYQNAGASCHGVDTLNDSKLTRTENRLINKTSSSVDVVCNLPIDAYATQGTNSGVVSYVALWARRYSGSGRTMSCTLTDGFYGETGAATYQPDAGNPVSLPNSGAQAIFQWTPSGSDKFFGPVNLRCTLAPYTELNDWFVKYDI
jgi:hypothetical protein